MICRCRKWAKVNNSLALYQLSYEGPLSFDGDRTHDLQIAVCTEHQSRVSSSVSLLVPPLDGPSAARLASFFPLSSQALIL